MSLKILISYSPNKPSLPKKKKEDNSPILTFRVTNIM